MSNQIKRTDILGCAIDVTDLKQALQAIETAIIEKKPTQVLTLNAEIVYQCQHDADLKASLGKADLITPDGIGVVWALRRAGYHVPGRVTGVELTEALADMAGRHGWRVFLFGAQPGVADEVAVIWQQKYAGIVIAGTRNGYFADSEMPAIMDSIREAGPDVLLVALGAPRQDVWIADNLQDLGVPVCIGVGGTFDVLSGRVKRAPRGWRRLGLEWLYRLISEPSRYKRQLALPKFAMLVLLHGGRKRSS